MIKDSITLVRTNEPEYEKVQCIGTCTEPFAKFGICNKFYCNERDKYKHYMPALNGEFNFIKKEV